MSNSDNCSCCGSVSLIFPCSGGSDVGEISDRAARKITRLNKGKMFCLAGIGGKVSGITESTKSAERILVIDGCPLDCAKKTLENAGIGEFLHFRITDQGLKKGKSPANDGNVDCILNKAVEMLNC